jgi:hypothetical protein
LYLAMLHATETLPRVAASCIFFVVFFSLSINSVDVLLSSSLS